MPLVVAIVAIGWLRATYFDERNAHDYFAKAKHSDTYFVTGVVSAPPILVVMAPLNPLETDMQAVLHTQNVHHRAFLKTNAW